MNQRIVTLIPARGGSQGVRRKNVAMVAGMPLVAYNITASLLSKSKETWVSTDSTYIKEVALRYGANVLDRPKSLGKADSTTESVIDHFLSEVECDTVILMQPTSPFTLPEDINRGIHIFVKGRFQSVFSCVETNDMLIWKFRGRKFGPINYDPRNRGNRQTRQDTIYWENGAFYIFTKKMFLRKQCRLGGKIGRVPMPFWRSFQVDEPEDLQGVRKLMGGWE